MVWSLLEAITQLDLCEIADTRISGRRTTDTTKRRWRDIVGDMRKYQLTEAMAQFRTYWMTKIMAGPAQGYCQER